MRIVERQIDDVTVLDLHGKILIGDGDKVLRDKMAELADAGHIHIVLNMDDAPDVDSAGLGEIIRCYTYIAQRGGVLKLLNLSAKIQNVLATDKLLSIFEYYNDEEEAVRSSFVSLPPRRRGLLEWIFG